MPPSTTTTTASQRTATVLMNQRQATAAISLISIPLISLFTAGCFLFVVPVAFLERLLSCSSNDKEEETERFLFQESTSSILDVRMARLVGSVLLGQVLSCLVLIYPLGILLHSSFTNQPEAITTTRQILVAQNSQHAAILDKFRSALASLCILGLLMVVGGLVDDRTASDSTTDHHDDQSCTTTQASIVIATGAITLISTLIAMMISFWQPEQPREEPLLVESSDNDPARVPLLASEQHEEEEHNNDNTLQDTETQQEEQPTSRIRGTMRLLKLAQPQVFYLYVGCAVLLVRLPFSLSIPHFVSTTLAAVSRADFEGARKEILLLFILGTIDAALDFWCVFLFGYANQRIVRGVRIDTFCSILKQEVAFFDKTTSGELASRLNSDCGEMAGDLTWFFRFSIESVVRISGIVSYMLIRCPILGGFALTIIPAVALVNKVYGNWLNKNAREVQDALAAANHVAQETFSCIRTVISFASEQQEYHKYKERIDHQYRLNVRQLYISGVYYMAVSTFLINTVVQATLLLIGTALIQHGKLTGEILLAFMLYQGQLQSETMNLFQSYTSLVKSSGAGDKVFALLDRRPAAPGTGSTTVLASEIEEASSTDQTSNNQTEGDNTIQAEGDNSHAPCSVEISNVGFSYPTRPDNVVLKDFSLKVPQGKTVALVGSSGCGKSTVVGLLQRYYDAAVGSIQIDGDDLRNLDVKQHRRRIGIVTQDPILFKGTILSNLLYGCPSATREDAIAAARMANALDFINSFPDGLETDVGERGIQLSGGQKQRVAIARAIIKKPSLLLLDEATSALDAESEQAVQEALDKLLKTNRDMTTLVIAHRLRTVRNADTIAFIENGRVAESGTHEELIQIGSGHYRKMVERAGNDGHLPDHVE
ncbi:Lactococcin transport/processing ATP-binding protein LcnC-like [Seminavis robusta]|uniref:Lactococcin transport/processing ATP-binding protein LcnC-like n=1 Tax=Seminavis robusta TaxID=568900 RepID=A0A9N8DD10_9STRA|nr:Lactococcin transport/processing ATP-binding protein LcnC-like [Seminavis robusta]|eukprot:Sro83_g044320.1 Lactococcin transport/processing ATP-binding protein LcnC-like (883) ;mRNA; f:47679-51486